MSTMERDNTIPPSTSVPMPEQRPSMCLPYMRLEIRLSRLYNSSGILKIVELFIAIIMLILDAVPKKSFYSDNTGGMWDCILCALVIVFSVTTMLIIAIVVMEFKQDTAFEFLYNIIACGLLIIAGVALLAKSSDTTLVINGVLGLVNAGLYAYGAFLAKGFQ